VVDVNRIDVEVVDGIAQLTGQVDKLLAKERASRIAGRVKGVRSVSNRIDVTPPPGLSDEQIQKDIADAIRSDPAADVYEVDVVVVDQVATLTGKVDSWAELQLTAKIAKAVRGVAAINNEIGVRVPEERLATEIRDDVRQRLRWHVMVDDGLIDVSVRDGAVTLEGVVGSLAEKRLAESLARVAGVTAVDASALQVKWWADDEALRTAMRR